MNNINLQNVIKKARVAAREILRAEKINQLLSNITGLEADIKTINERIVRAIESMEKRNRDIAGMEYDLSKLDTEDPRYVDKKERIERDIKEKKELFAFVNKDEEKDIKESEEQIVTAKELIEKLNETITKWQNGENKVELERMTNIANTITAEWLAAEGKKGMDEVASTESEPRYSEEN